MKEWFYGTPPLPAHISATAREPGETSSPHCIMHRFILIFGFVLLPYGQSSCLFLFSLFFSILFVSEEFSWVSSLHVSWWRTGDYLWNYLIWFLIFRQLPPWNAISVQAQNPATPAKSVQHQSPSVAPRELLHMQVRAFMLHGMYVPQIKKCDVRKLCSHAIFFMFTIKLNLAVLEF